MEYISGITSVRRLAFIYIVCYNRRNIILCGDFMDCFVNEADFALIDRDRFTFNVLTRILRGECELVLSDHEKVIICHSDSKMNYPVWVWTPDDCYAEEMERAWKIVNEARPVTEGYKYNLKHELADYFMARAEELGHEMEVDTNLFAYDCPKLIAPENEVDGYLHCVTDDEVDEVIAHKLLFYECIGDSVGDRETFETNARDQVARRTYFFWKNAEGKAVASCSFKVTGELACLSGVLTLPEYRRRHYAQNMVYALTKLLMEQGFTPMLYTDADYAASNACYQKVGYVRRGGLCTIRKR